MPNFWTSPTFEPKRQFRFLVRLGLPNSGGDAGSLEFMAKQVSRPSYTVNSNPHKFFNHTFHYPGRVEWGTISMTLVDAVSPNASDIFMELLGQIGYANPDAAVVDNTPAIMTKTITKASATAALGTVLIIEMGADDDGESRERGTWTLNNAFITSVNFGDHSYESEDLIDIQLEMQYDWASYDPKN